MFFAVSLRVKEKFKHDNTNSKALHGMAKGADL